jgi:hypothetical protein
VLERGFEDPGELLDIPAEPARHEGRLEREHEIHRVKRVLGNAIRRGIHLLFLPRKRARLPRRQTIVGVIVGGALAGVSGMFLSLPVIAVLKIVFDRTSSLKQWGVLFGDERPQRSPMSFPVFRKKTKAVQQTLEAQNKIEPPKKDS